MLIRTIRLDAQGQPAACPHCDNEELTQGAYCMICGSHIANALAELRLQEKEVGTRRVLQGDSDQ